MYHWGGSGWWMWGMGIFWIFVVVAVVLAALWVARSSRGGGGAGQGSRVSAPPRDDSPEEILKRRYARGEIDDEEYRHKLEELRR